MQFSQIEAFVEIARQGNITRAAEVLFITQPTVTERLRGLEREIGQPLFTRLKYGVALTDAGKTLLPHARQILQAVSAAKTALDNLATAAQGELCLGAASFVNLSLLPTLLERFTSKYPGVRLSVRTGHCSEDVLEMVLRDDVQIGLIRNLPHRDVQAIKLYEDEILLVAAHSHPFSQRVAVTMEEIAQEGVIACERGISHYETVNSMFLNAGLVLKSSAATDTPETAIRMVERGLGITLLSRTAVQREIESGSLKIVPIADSPSMTCEMVAVYRKTGGLGGIAQAFLNNIRETLAL